MAEGKEENMVVVKGAKTGLQVGRAVKNVISGLEVQSGVEFQPDEKRKILRHF